MYDSHSRFWKRALLKSSLRKDHLIVLLVRESLFHDKYKFQSKSGQPCCYKSTFINMLLDFRYKRHVGKWIKELNRWSLESFRICLKHETPKDTFLFRYNFMPRNFEQEFKQELFDQRKTFSFWRWCMNLQFRVRLETC